MAGNNMFQTFLLLKDGVNPKALEAKFPAFVDRYIGKALKSMGFYKKQFLIPVKDMHLHSGMDSNISSVGSTASLYILGAIALFNTGMKPLVRWQAGPLIKHIFTEILCQ